MSIEAMKQALDVIKTYSPEYMHGLPKKHYIKHANEPRTKWAPILKGEKT